MRNFQIIKRIQRTLKLLRLASGTDHFLSDLSNVLSSSKDTFRPVSDIPPILNLQDFLQPYHSTSLNIPDSSTLDIGCGPSPRNPFGAKFVHGIDIRENLDLNIRKADLTIHPIPYGDDTFNYITAFDFIEHIPRVIYCPSMRFAFVELMNEVFRTLKPNGIFLSHTPIFPFDAAFRDPTHVNILTSTTFPMYFDEKNRLASIYGFRGSFHVLNQGLRAPHLVTVLQKV
jgi:SAM-dependent methyltransferase